MNLKFLVPNHGIRFSSACYKLKIIAPVEKSGTQGARTEKKKAFHPYGKKPTDEREVIVKLPILRFGKGNNFHKF